MWIQNLLFDIGAEIASNPENIKRLNLNVFNSKHTTTLEQTIDLLSEELPELKNFVLPGGHMASSQAHVLRTVCRRAERYLVKYNLNFEQVNPDISIFINRLSDYFFVLARYIVVKTDNEEVTWTKQS